MMTIAEEFYNLEGEAWGYTFTVVDSYNEVFGLNLEEYFAVEIDEEVFGFWFEDGYCVKVEKLA